MIFKKEEELWITNISRKQDASIGDLRITLRCGQSINLLAKKKNGLPMYTLTRKQIDDSITSGSIFQKRDRIKVRVVAPIIFNHRIDVVESIDRSSTRLNRKATPIEVPEFSDLDIPDDDKETAEEAAKNADMDFADKQPLLAVDPKFKKVRSDEE